MDKQKIFLIEDDADIARMYERAFRLNGFTVEFEPDGKKALDKIMATEQKPDAILLDLLIPSLSGIDVLRELKANPATRIIPVIVLTNVFSPDNEDLFLSLGASFYLTKMNHDAPMIVEKVRHCLEDARPLEKVNGA